MSTFRWRTTESLGDEAFPLRAVRIDATISVETADVDIPDAAVRRIAIDALRAQLSSIDASNLEEGRQEERPRRAWQQPAGIDMRILKSAHRVVMEVARRGHGRMVLASHLVRDGLVSAPTMSRLLNREESSGQYLAPFIQVTPAGRTKGIDLTAAGRRLASLIRAGEVPV